MAKTTIRNCVVQDCTNTSAQGTFTGDLCTPCHNFIAHGVGSHSQAYRNSLLIFAERFGQMFARQLVEACDPTGTAFLNLDKKDG